MFGAVFVKDGIRVVDVDQDLATFGVLRILLHQSSRTGNRKVPDLTSCFLAAARLKQLVVTPKGAVEEYEVAGFSPLFPLGIAPRESRRNENLFPGVLESQSDNRFFRRQRSSQIPADVIRILSPQGYSVGNELRNFLGIMPFSRVDMIGERQGKPLHGRLGAPKNSEDRVLFRQNAPDGGHGKNLEGLKFPQMQQTHKRIDIRVRQINVEDSRGRPGVGKRSQVRGSDDLGAKVWRGVNERPISAKGILRVCCNRDLSWSAWTSVYRTAAE